MRFAKSVFLVAGIYGIAVLIPQYFLEARNAVDFPPPITHPEYFYGFTGVALAFQFVFLVISRDPVRYRPMMIPSVIEKFSFAGAAIVLFYLDRIHAAVLAFGMIDMVLGVLFAASFIVTPSEQTFEG
ncbi:MAG: hypothetical protein J5I65_13220 [Aridibacter famidurans]|nr:hypothetical protein [Aridibacter famidurans]